MTAQTNSAAGPTTAAPKRVAKPHPIAAMLLKRLAWGVLTVLVVAVIVYAATLVLPGDAAQAILGKQATPDRVALLRRQLGLDQSAWSAFVSWFTGIFRGALGTSLSTGQPVTVLLGPKILNSAALVLVTAVVSTAIGLALGALTASRRDGVLDQVVSLISLVASALPEFIVGVFVVLALAVKLHAFPAISVLPPGEQIWDEPAKMVLPVLTLTIVVVPYILRMCRGSVIEALDSDYAEVARLKGVSRHRLLYRHAMPNALAPAVQVVALSLIYLAGGIVLVETVFQFPGVGLALLDAITARDVPVIQAIVLLLSACYVVLNILADIGVLLVTPRRRLPR